MIATRAAGCICRIFHATRAAAVPIAGSAAVLATPAHAEDGPHATASLVAEHASIRVGGTTTLALSFEIEPGWHLYWNGRNDTGFAPEWMLDLPEGWTAGPPQWPVAKRYVAEGDILDHIYEERLTILIPLRIPASASPGEFPVTARANWLVCMDACVPEDAEVHAIVRVDRREDQAETHRELFARGRAAMPRPAGELPDGLKWRSLGHELSARVPGASAIEFHPDAEGPELAGLSRSGRAEGSEITLTLADARPGWIPPERHLRGTLVVEREEIGADGARRIVRSGYRLGVPELAGPGGEHAEAPEGRGE